MPESGKEVALRCVLGRGGVRPRDLNGATTIRPVRNGDVHWALSGFGAELELRRLKGVPCCIGRVCRLCSLLSSRVRC